ncbi:MAG: hypothetical protein ACI4I2_00205 [Oscillospiraceae bacterium]
MNLYFKKSQSSVRPQLIDTASSKKFVYIRQNIVETVIDDTTFYEYDEAKLTKSEYEEYLKELEATDTLKIVENLKDENKQLSETVDMLTNCILEMSEIIYE